MENSQTLHIAVISANVALAILMIVIAWRTQKLKHQLALWNEAIELTDTHISKVLAKAPSQFAHQTTRLRQFQKSYIRWQTNLQRLQQILWLLSAGIRMIRK